MCLTSLLRLWYLLAMETHEPVHKRSPFIDMFLRTIAVLGLIAVLILGAWGIIQLAVAIPAIFSTLGSGTSSLFTGTSAKESMTVSTAATINSGQTLQVSWTHAQCRHKRTILIRNFVRVRNWPLAWRTGPDRRISNRCLQHTF